MRQVRVTGGYSAKVAATVREVTGGSMAGLDVKACLRPEGQLVQPAAAALVWQAGDLSVGNGLATIELTVLDTTPPGHYWLWLRVQEGVNVPAVVLVRDDDGAPLHIYVT